MLLAGCVASGLLFETRRQDGGCMRSPIDCSDKKEDKVCAINNKGREASFLYCNFEVQACLFPEEEWVVKSPGFCRMDYMYYEPELLKN